MMITNLFLRTKVNCPTKGAGSQKGGLLTNKFYGCSLLGITLHVAFFFFRKQRTVHYYLIAPSKKHYSIVWYR